MMRRLKFKVGDEVEVHYAGLWSPGEIVEVNDSANFPYRVNSVTAGNSCTQWRRQCAVRPRTKESSSPEVNDSSHDYRPDEVAEYNDLKFPLLMGQRRES